ncbi:hypothetical protein J6590_090179 [Homalodisca vitripennis]|nr:hypothetical protein J6590_090179 [Homalodisca vitripennis]
MSGNGYLIAWQPSPRTCWQGMGRAHIRQRIPNCVATVTPDMLAGHGKSSCNGYLIAWQPSPRTCSRVWEELISGNEQLIAWQPSSRTCGRGWEELIK